VDKCRKPRGVLARHRVLRHRRSVLHGRVIRVNGAAEGLDTLATKTGDLRCVRRSIIDSVRASIARYCSPRLAPRACLLSFFAGGRERRAAIVARHPPPAAGPGADAAPLERGLSSARPLPSCPGHRRPFDRLVREGLNSALRAARRRRSRYPEIGSEAVTARTPTLQGPRAVSGSHARSRGIEWRGHRPSLRPPIGRCRAGDAHESAGDPGYSSAEAEETTRATGGVAHGSESRPPRASRRLPGVMHAIDVPTRVEREVRVASAAAAAAVHVQA
jgi:hypothetical protein